MKDKTLYYRYMIQSKHFQDMLTERGIEQEWVSHAIEAPVPRRNMMTVLATTSSKFLIVEIVGHESLSMFQARLQYL